MHRGVLATCVVRFKNHKKGALSGSAAVATLSVVFRATDWNRPS